MYNEVERGKDYFTDNTENMMRKTMLLQKKRPQSKTMTAFVLLA